tara:strand:- start:628 stop:825 length:198 start_codon:yes stop_codon:yes gene_type:complete
MIIKKNILYIYMLDYNEIMKNYMKKPEEENKIEKKHKKKKINPKKMEKIFPMYAVFGRPFFELVK